MEIEIEDYIREAIRMALHMQETKSQPHISGHRVGACLIASDIDEEVRCIGGANIEIAASFNVHAERSALINAISRGFVNFHAIVVTSKEKATATMCGYCRQDYLYIKPEIPIFVINPDGTVGIEEKLIDTMKYPYLGRSKLKLV